MFQSDRQRWLAAADEARPPIRRSRLLPQRIVDLQRDPSAWHGWATPQRAEAGELSQLTATDHQPVVIDLGRHAVGYLRLRLAVPGDGPIAVRFGEIAAEVAEPVDLLDGRLGHEWLQPTIFDPAADGTVEDPRRRACRYVRIEPGPDGGVVTVQQLWLEQVTTAANAAALGRDVPERLRQIDAVACTTLRNCMHDVFEDGPKRDRRLWLGDLRVQAQTNYVTFGRSDLVRRCLYLHAACARPDGSVPACVFARPHWHHADEFIPDYALLYGPTLLDYAQATDDWDTAADLWPIALHQARLIDRYADDTGLMHMVDGVWFFIDWNEMLDRQTALHGVALYSLERLAQLGERLGHQDDADRLRERAERLWSVVQQQLWDADRGLFVSGPQRQVSWASQVWMILGAPMECERGRRLFEMLEQVPGAIRPITPYLYHHVVQAMLQCGLTDRASALIDAYWGGMIDRGATTFWEVFDPDDPYLSPYGSHIHNSYCHAWSCTPSWFIRRGLLGEPAAHGSPAAEPAN
jgi:hypothetical protein